MRDAYKTEIRLFALASDESAFDLLCAILEDMPSTKLSELNEVASNLTKALGREDLRRTKTDALTSESLKELTSSDC